MREKAITRTSIIGIVVNIIFAAFKAAAGLLAGSIAIMLDAVNNLSDALSSIITIVGIKVAKRRPDDKHPFGYGRMEYFSTILIAILVLVAGCSSIVESGKRIFNTELPDYSVVTIVIIVASVIMKLVLGRFVSSQGKKYNSDALIASGAEASFDAIISASTLLGAVVTFIFHFSIDGFIGVFISVFIIKAGIEMLLEAIGDVIGNRPDSVVSKEIKRTITELDGVNGAYDLILHNYGPDRAIGTVHIEVDGDMSAVEIHKLTRKIQEKIFEDFHIALTIGIYAVDQKNDEKVSMRERIDTICKTHDGVINTHGYFINADEKVISFDVGIDFTISDREAFEKTVKSEVEKEYPDFRAYINLDSYYSD